MGGKKPTPKHEVGEVWDLEEIKRLMDLLADRGIAEFELEKNGLRVRIRRESPRHEAVPVAAQAPAPGAAANSADVVPAETPASAAAAEAAEDREPAEDVFVIKSPIVGTFYAAPAPNAPPFVNVGDNVQVGQVLCIIEAMKLMNEIESEVAGEVARAYLENGQPVEYGQPLFAIKPSHKK